MCCVFFCAFLILLVLHSQQLVYSMRSEGVVVIVSMCSADLLN